jgi:hypothetical protein
MARGETDRFHTHHEVLQQRRAVLRAQEDAAREVRSLLEEDRVATRDLADVDHDSLRCERGREMAAGRKISNRATGPAATRRRSSSDAPPSALRRYNSSS